jgi:hypothetical protein
MTVKQDDKSKLEGMMQGNTLENKQQNAAEFVAPGGRGVNDYSLEAPGLANILRTAAEANERTMQSMPVVFDQSIDKNFVVIKEMLAGSLQRMELLQRKSTPRQKLMGGRAICPTSLSIGLMIGFLLSIGICWFWVVPSQVAHERGTDWAIGEYLSTPEGRAVRQHFRNCKTKGCKS